MARYGFRADKEQMKIFILFVMSHAIDLVEFDDMSEMVLIDDNIDYFLYTECVAELLEDGQLLKEKAETGEERYTLSPRGYDLMKIVESSLPIALRRAATETARDVMARVRRRACIQTEIVFHGVEPMAKLTLRDRNTPILIVQIMAGSETEAKKICRNFEKNAEYIFNDVAHALVNPYTEKDE